MIAAALMIGAVVGQLITSGFAVAEIAFRGYFGLLSIILIAILLAAAGTGTILCANNSVRFYLNLQAKRAEDSKAQLKALIDSLASRHEAAAPFDPGDRRVYSAEEQTIFDNLTTRGEPVPPTWKMF